jgi:hypothetical protein
MEAPEGLAVNVTSCICAILEASESLAPQCTQVGCFPIMLCLHADCFLSVAQQLSQVQLMLYSWTTERIVIGWWRMSLMLMPPTLSRPGVPP